MSSKSTTVLTVLGFVIALLALLRDTFAVEVSIDSMILSIQENYLWLLPIGIILGYLISPWIRNKLHSNKITTNIDVYDLESEEERLQFANSLEESYGRAKDEIILTGRGFQKDDDIAKQIIDKLADKHESILKKGVKITRIQTHNVTTDHWISRYKSILEKHASKFQLYLDLDHSDFVNIALIDPNMDNPTVQLLFEVEHNMQSSSKRYAGAIGVFIYGKKELSRSLYKQLVSRLDNTKIISSNNIGELALSEKYFAYGSNINYSQMKQRCPSAKKIGVATLYGYEFVFNVYAPHLDSYAGGIKVNAKKSTVGILYAMSSKDRKALDEFESPGYSPVMMDIKLNDSQKHSKAIVYLPNSDFVREEDGSPSSKYLSTILEGAKDNDLDQLIEYLEKK